MKSLLAKIALSTFILFTSIHSQATTYTNQGTNTGSIANLGAPGAFSFGETFTSPGGILQNFNFWADHGDYAGNVVIGLAAWDGNKIVGPALYTSAPILYEGSLQAIGTSNINLALPTGLTYVVYLTVIGVTDPLSMVTFRATHHNGGLLKLFVSQHSEDPNVAWLPWDGGHLEFEANFTSAVPEPETYGMLLAGLGIIGFALRRKFKLPQVQAASSARRVQ